MPAEASTPLAVVASPLAEHWSAALAVGAPMVPTAAAVSAQAANVPATPRRDASSFPRPHRFALSGRCGGSRTLNLSQPTASLRRASSYLFEVLTRVLEHKRRFGVIERAAVDLVAGSPRVHQQGDRNLM